MNFHEAWWKKNPSPLPTSTTTSNHSPFLSTGLVSRGLWLYLTLSLKCLAYGKPWSKLFCSKTHRAQCQKKSSVHFMYKWTEVPDERRPSSLSPRELVAVMRLEPMWSDPQTTMSPAVLHWCPCCCDIWDYPHSHSPWPISLPLAYQVNKHLQHISSITWKSLLFLTWLLLQNNFACSRWGSIYWGDVTHSRLSPHTYRLGNCLIGFSTIGHTWESWLVLTKFSRNQCRKPECLFINVNKRCNSPSD